MPKPTTTFIRRGEAVRWLGEHGIGKKEVEAIIQDGLIAKRYTRPKARALYLVAEIETKILAPMLAREDKKS